MKSVHEDKMFITFDQATQNVIKLHSHYLSKTSPPLHPSVFYTAVNHAGWAVSHMLVNFWRTPQRYEPPESLEGYYKEEEALIIPKNPAEAFLLTTPHIVSSIPYTWEIPQLAFTAFSKLPEVPLSERITTLGGAFSEWMKDSFETASQSLVEDRKAICKVCPYWSDKGYLGLGVCKKCGCSGLKLKMRVSKCPIGSW